MSHAKDKAKHNQPKPSASRPNKASKSGKGANKSTKKRRKK